MSESTCADSVWRPVSNAGAFTVWPGSHHKCFRYLTTHQDGAKNGYPHGNKNLTGGPDGRPTWARGMAEAWEWCEKHITPVDCYGSAGTVVFYHNKLAHMAGQNYRLVSHLYWLKWCHHLKINYFSII